VKVLFVSSGNSSSGINPIIRKQGESLIKSGLNLIFFGVSGKGLKAYLMAAIQLRRRLRQEKFDVIHAHYALCMYVAWFARRKEKLVVSFMGTDIIGGNDIEGNFTFAGKVLSKIHVLFAKRFCEKVIVKSSGMAKIFGEHHRKLRVIPNGVDIQLFEPISKEEARNKIGWDSSKKYIIFVSNPERPEKNFNLAQAGVELLNDPSIVLVPVFKKEMGTLKYYYSAADVVIMTSFHEGSPNVVKESMSCNCNLVCTDVGDVKEYFSGLENCWITSWDATDVAEKIKLALLRKSSENNSRDFLISIGLTEDQVASRIRNIYNQ
jgi:teichuronic acid biosynthesis glycosyltransferase TuaC